MHYGSLRDEAYERVTNVILTTCVSECHDEINFVNAISSSRKQVGAENSKGQRPRWRLQAHGVLRLFVGFNHADTGFILTAIDKAPWRDKAMVQAYVKEQEEDTFSLRYDGKIIPKVLETSR